MSMKSEMKDLESAARALHGAVSGLPRSMVELNRKLVEAGLHPHHVESPECKMVLGVLGFVAGTLLRDLSLEETCKAVADGQMDPGWMSDYGPDHADMMRRHVWFVRDELVRLTRAGRMPAVMRFVVTTFYDASAAGGVLSS